MARIRSVHPSLWTDEDFVSLSLPARLFLIGLWNESDDHGLFAWKPLALKMRLAPADNIDASAILNELHASGFIVKISRDNRDIGVVRNFRKFQRPKNPSAPMVSIDAEIEKIAGIEGDVYTRVNPPSWHETRLRIFARDGFRCTYCGRNENLQCDHIIPVVQGGSDLDDNLTTACRSCNASKGAKSLEEWLK